MPKPAKYVLSLHRASIILERTRMALEVHALTVEDLRKRVPADHPVWVPLRDAIEAEERLVDAIRDLEPVYERDVEDGMSKKLRAEIWEAFGAPVS